MQTATTQRLPPVHPPGSPNGSQPCDCRRQRHVKLPAELGGVWCCLGCGSRFAEAERKPLRQRVREMCKRYDVEIVFGVLPIVAILGVLLAEAVIR